MTPTEFYFHCYEFFMWCLRVMIVLAALVLIYVVFLLYEAKGADIECKAEPDKTARWAWRYIDPHNQKRCWYRGTRLLPKSSLRWPKDHGAVKSVTWYPRPFERTAPINPPPLLDPFEAVDECCWPELNEFDKRFVGSK